MSPLEKQFLKAYDEFADPIFRHCYFRVFNRERAKDLMQETFTKTWEYLNQSPITNHESRITNMRAFLYRVANNLIIDNSRKKHERSLDQMQEEGFDPGEDTRSRLIGLMEAGEVIKMLDKVNPKYRQVIQMRYLDDLSPKEIAETIGESENNVSVRLHRGLKEIREILEYSENLQHENG